ncbi:hypothetical protein Ancab_010333 [Ancistrocladus abbreviatus]
MVCVSKTMVSIYGSSWPNNVVEGLWNPPARLEKKIELISIDPSTEEKTYLEFARFSVLTNVPSFLSDSIPVMVDNELFNAQNFSHQSSSHYAPESFVKDSYGRNNKEVIKLLSMAEENTKVERKKKMAEILQMTAEKIATQNEKDDG